MDDFYAACQEKVQNATDPAAAINELASISLHDLPEVQLCKFVEQTITLLSVIFQVTASSQQDLLTKFQEIRQQLKATLDYMEQIMEAERTFPPPQPNADGCWW